MWKLIILGRFQLRDVPGRMQRKILSAIASTESFWDGLGLELWRFFCLHPFWAWSGPETLSVSCASLRDPFGGIEQQILSAIGLTESFWDGLGLELWRFFCLHPFWACSGPETLSVSCVSLVRWKRSNRELLGWSGARVMKVFLFTQFLMFTCATPV